VSRGTRPVRIANCSGFYGDRAGAAREMVSGGDLDVLTGDWLAELTMSILDKDRARRPGGGWARTFLRELGDVIEEVAARGIKVVSNAGGLNPAGCAEAVAALVAERGLDLRVASVSGDDLSPRFAELRAAGETFAHLRTGEPWPAARGEPATANAYLGAWGIAAALEAGADIVVTGRVTDASVVVGPAAWWWDWAPGDWDRLAGAVAAGHVIECGAQATGGNFAFFREVPDMVELGLPLAEVDRDGSVVITKHPGTAGIVTVDTVTAQLLYEVQDPAYLGPDVTLRLDSLRLEQAGPDRVRIAGAVGEPPPETLKVSMTSAGGWQNSVTFILTGLDIEQKAEAALAALWARTPGGREAFATAAVDLVGGGGGREGTTDGPPLALLKVTVQDPDEATVGRAFSDAAVQIGLASYPGLYYSAPPANAKPSQRYWPGTVSAAAVTQRVLFEGAELPVKVPPERRSPVPPVLVGEVWSPPPGDQVPVAFGRVFGARSGDKGGDLNIGVWARSDAAAAWLLAEFDAKALVEAVPTYAGLVIDRYPLPNLRAVNFVLRDGLGEGVAAGTLVDTQGKAAGEILRAARVHLPVDLALSAGGVGRSRSTGYD